MSITYESQCIFTLGKKGYEIKTTIEELSKQGFEVKAVAPVPYQEGSIIILQRVINKISRPFLGPR